MQTKAHPKIQALTEKRQRDLDALYSPKEGLVDRAKAPLYEPAEQQKQLALVEQRYKEGLEKLATQAEEDHRNAMITISRVDNPYNWLTPTEAAHAASIAPFVKEDIERAKDIDGLTAIVRRAASGATPLRWLTARYAMDRITALSANGELGNSVDPRVIEAREGLLTSLVALRNTVIPAGDKKIYQEARARAAEAAEIRDSANLLKALSGR